MCTFCAELRKKLRAMTAAHDVSHFKETIQMLNVKKLKRVNVFCLEEGVHTFHTSLRDQEV